MNHLLEILKIIEGGMKSDRATVAAYTEQLAEKLTKDGEKKAANRLKRALTSFEMQTLTTSNMVENPRVPVDPESRLSLAQEDILDPLDAQIFLEPETEHSVDEFLNYIRNANQFIEHGVSFSPTLLLHGPPGCGKTQLAKYIAASLELPLITARLDSLVSSFLGSTSKNIRNLFEHAKSRPCVLFLDEFDAIAKLRDDQHEQGELKRVVVSLLQNIDFLDSETILLAATNHPHLLDSAVWRRFAYKLELGSPSKEVRFEMFSQFLGILGDEKKIEIFTSSSENLSGAMIREVCDAASRDAVLDGTMKVSSTNVLKKLLILHEISINRNGNLDECIMRAREVSHKAFTYERLSKIFGRSTGYISNLISEKG